jgi:hypothetical protein
VRQPNLYKVLFSLLLILSVTAADAQRDIIRGIGNRIPNIGGRGGGGQDSLKTRTNAEDSITIRFYYLDSTRSFTLDSGIQDYTKRFPIPATHIYLGNTGAATRSILFEPMRKAGFDPGFHAYDAYKWKLENVRFFNTTRPYTEIGYSLASKAEQLIELLHTQNFKPYWNVSLHYRLINAPGTFKNQKTYHNNYQITSWYESPNKRYNNYVVFLKNKLQSQESGGIKNDKDYLNDPDLTDRFVIPTKLGGDPPFGRDFFKFSLNTGNLYNESTMLLRQQYDLGKKDSLVTDSTVIPLFFPRLRFEHTLKYGSYDYIFRDDIGDSVYYAMNYRLKFRSATDSLRLEDKWKEISNDFSIYQFPDAKNLHQFFKAGIEYQILKGTFKTGSKDLYNFIAHAEYRNHTRNQKWDMLGFGRLYMNGFNSGDYHAYASLQRLVGKKLGSLQVGFENINRSPSFIFDTRSSFYLDTAQKSFSKENTAHMFARIYNAPLRLELGADYFFISNYMYLKNFRELQQENAIFSLLRLSALKTMKIIKNINLHTEVYVQQKTGAVELNFPALFTRNRLSYDGNFGFKNLNFSGGIEMRYHTPYKADNYSPVQGQFFYQDSITIQNRPDLHAFVHFRIKSFKAYIRFENLNAASFSTGGFGFTRNNFAAPDYPIPGLIFRFGIYWSFVN